MNHHPWRDLTTIATILPKANTMVSCGFIISRILGSDGLWWSDAALGSEMKSCGLQANLSYKQRIGKTKIDPQVWHQGWFQPWEWNICQTTIATILPQANTMVSYGFIISRILGSDGLWWSDAALGSETKSCCLQANVSYKQRIGKTKIDPQVWHQGWFQPWEWNICQTTIATILPQANTMVSYGFIISRILGSDGLWWSDAALGSETKSCCLQANVSYKQRIGKTIIDPQVWHQGWFQPWEWNICQTTIATILPQANTMVSYGFIISRILGSDGLWWSDAALGSETKSCCLQANVSHKQRIGKTIIDPQVWHQGWLQPWEWNICQTTIANHPPKNKRNGFIWFHHITYPRQWWSVMKWCCIRVWNEILLPSSKRFIQATDRENQNRPTGVTPRLISTLGMKHMSNNDCNHPPKNNHNGFIWFHQVRNIKADPTWTPIPLPEENGLIKFLLDTVNTFRDIGVHLRAKAFVWNDETWRLTRAPVDLVIAWVRRRALESEGFVIKEMHCRSLENKYDQTKPVEKKIFITKPGAHNPSRMQVATRKRSCDKLPASRFGSKGAPNSGYCTHPSSHFCLCRKATASPMSTSSIGGRVGAVAADNQHPRV